MGTFSPEEYRSPGEFWGDARGNHSVVCRRNPPKREKNGAVPRGEKGRKMQQKRTRSELLQALFGCHYMPDIMRVLNQTLSTLVNVFFKTHTLSANFVHLSVLRWHFFTPSQISKISFFATFSFVLSACPGWRNFELFPRNK